ncbi:PAS domain-containing sensor histidine kinase [Vogesella alkaliphila]|uniref:histidine kinase n=1 Tax=Vogesella alkaliphila TaxID=1193621 RepID=A0ABQ2YSH4_9NEIS|nr:PAS domain S-box protein [Vogesella alkaliphila]GGX90950.1 hypothetical protein GCM10011290_18340 [Vogesella alkaliphila]
MRTQRFYQSLKRSRFYRLMPNSTIVLFFLTMAVMLWTLDARETEQLRLDLAKDTLWAEQTLRLRLDEHKDELSRLARDIGREAIDEDQFLVQASEFLANTPEMAAVVWADNSFTLRWIAPYEESRLTVGSGLSGVSASAYLQARTDGRSVMSQPYQLDSGEWRFDLMVPVFRDTQFRGMVIGIYKASVFIRRVPPSWFAEKYYLELNNGEQSLVRNSHGAPSSRLSQSIVLGGTPLQLVARPVRGDNNKGRVIQLGLIVGLSLLTLLSLMSLSRHIRRRVDAERERDRVYGLSREWLGVMREDGYLLHVNPAFVGGLGYPAEQLLGTSILNYLHPDERESTQQLLRQVIEAGSVDRYVETRVINRAQEVRAIAWAMSPLPDAGVVYLSGRDITAEKQAEQALRHEYMFRKAMEDSLVVGIRAIALDGRITYVNPAFCRITGYDEAELIGLLPPYPYWSPDIAHHNYDALRQTLSGEQSQQLFESVMQRKNGERFYAQLLISPLIDADGHQTGWMAALTDMTEKRHAQQMLEAANERFIAVIEGLDAAVAVVRGESQQLLFCNHRYREWLAAPATEDSSECCDLRLYRLLQQASADQEIWLDDLQRWFLLRSRPVRWVDSEMAQMLILTDITEQHDAEQRYQEQMAKLQATSRLITMGEMASTLAHELNQPLSAIANYQAGCVERLRQGRATPESLIPVMEKITAQAERAGKIVRRVREFVKQSEPVCKPCQPSDIIDAALAIAEIEARRLGSVINVHLAANLPAVNVDPILIEQVLLNLIKNGMEAMQQLPPAQRELQVSVQRSSSKRVEVAIVDCGHGVPDDIKSQLFDAFFTTKSEGMGMGLNICRSIVEFHQGQLSVEDHPLGGTIFRFTLPVYEP